MNEIFFFLEKKARRREIINPKCFERRTCLVLCVDHLRCSLMPIRAADPISQMSLYLKINSTWNDNESEKKEFSFTGLFDSQIGLQ